MKSYFDVVTNHVMLLKDYFFDLRLFFCSITHYGQSNDREMVLYKVGFAYVLSGVKALINKKLDEKWHKVLLKGIAQGEAI
jgi:hypothetical protein